jgi:hypothetical protein
MNHMPKYLHPREQTVHLDRRRGRACYEYVQQVANDGDDKALSFLDALHGGAFDECAADSRFRLFVRPFTVAKSGNGVEP